jgi:hypothetical protein
MGTKTAEKTPKERMNDAVKAILKSNFAGIPAGTDCLKILKIYCENCYSKDEEKFRNINMENKNYIAKVESVVGGKHFLLAAGFVQDSTSKTLTYPTPVNKELLQSAIEILSASV